jgi:tetratricopeptide (TPR) repeat protein
MDKLIDWLLELAKSKKRPLAVLFIALAVVAYTWYDWDHVKELPGITKILALFEHRGRLPMPDKTKLSIGVVHLDGDDKGEIEHVIWEDLKTPPIDAEEIDRLIETTDVEIGRKQARDLLQKSGFDVIIWGTLLTAGDKVVPKIYWTTNGDRADNDLKPTQKAFDDDLHLPPVFWADFSNVLGLVVTTSAGELLGSTEGHYIVDKLHPFIERTRSLVDGMNTKQMDAATHAKLSRLLGDALETLGEQSGNNAALAEAVRRYRAALSSYRRDRVPLDWAMTQDNLGVALEDLGERESGTARLQQAIIAFQNALLEFTRKRVPLDWAHTQNNLGVALDELGERESGTARLQQAVTAFQNTLLELTRKRVPLDWAHTQNNLGVALEDLGERESGTAHLQQGRHHLPKRATRILAQARSAGLGTDPKQSRHRAHDAR